MIGMADGYAQATCNAGFVNLHSAAGVGNALGNVYTAHRNQTPLVITAGQQARSILPLQAVPLCRARLGISAAICEIRDRAGAGRGRAGGDRARLLRGDAAALRPDLRLGADRRLEPSGAAGRGPQRQPRDSAPIPPRSMRWSTALAASPQPGARGRPRRRSRAGGRSDGARGGEGARRGLGQPVFGALQFPGAAPAIRRLPAGLAGAIVGGAAWPRPCRRDRRASIYLPRRGPRVDFRWRDHAVPDHRRSRCRGR